MTPARPRVLLTRPEYKGKGVTKTTINPAKDKPTPPTPLTGGMGGGVVAGSPGKSISTGRRIGKPTFFQEFQTQALALDIQERKELLAQLLLAQAEQADPGTDVDLWAAAVSSALQATLRGANGVTSGKLLARKLLGVSNAWAPVKDFAVAVGFDSMTRVEKQSAYQLLASLLMEHVRYVARKSGAPLSLKLVASCAPNLAGVFDQAFPGYLASGLAMLPFRQYARRKDGPQVKIWVDEADVVGGP